MQSPTLLNNLAQSKAWQIEVTNCGGMSAVKEQVLLNFPRDVFDAMNGGKPIWWKGETKGVAMFWACAPDHVRFAREHLPGVPIVWVVHSGGPGYLPKDASDLPLVGFNTGVLRSAKLEGHGASYHLISPAYTLDPIWSWWPRFTWTIKSRIWDRRPQDLDDLKLAVRDAGQARHTLYGEGAPGGFLSPEQARSMGRACAGYLAALRDWSGFGLSEHERMAQGVPVISRWWGDMHDEAPSHRGMVETLAGLVLFHDQLAMDETFARKVSEDGLDYIARCRTLESLNESAERLLDEIA